MTRIIHHNQIWFTSGMEISFNIEQSITKIISIYMSVKKKFRTHPPPKKINQFNINRIKKKNHLIISMDIKESN